MLASVFIPRASGDRLAELSRYLRGTATGEAAAGFLELDFATDLRDVLPEVSPPALVLHRSGDRAVPIELGRELASLLPNARFVPISGDSHFPWVGDQRELQRALAGFLSGTAAEADDDSPLTNRETQVLRLVATGLSNREIASSLILSEHTVHRHVTPEHPAGQVDALDARSRVGVHLARAGLI